MRTWLLIFWMTPALGGSPTIQVAQFSTENLCLLARDRFLEEAGKVPILSSAFCVRNGGDDTEIYIDDALLNAPIETDTSDF